MSGAMTSFVARRPWFCIVATFSISVALSAVGLSVGDFSVAVDNRGWTSRGTKLANRYAQWLVARTYLRPGSTQDPVEWDFLVDNVQPGWEVERKERRRDLEDIDVSSFNNSGVLEGCDPSWYTFDMLDGTNRLWPVWRANEDMSGSVLLTANALRDLCLAEEETQRVLEENGLCEKCSEAKERTKCLPPYSLVLFARFQVEGGLDMECADLASEWIKYTEAIPTLELELKECLATMAQDPDYHPLKKPFDLPAKCPQFFLPLLVDIGFRETGTLSFTSSIFATHDVRGKERDLYELVPKYSRGTDLIEGAYDTQNEDFIEILVDDSSVTDMILALVSVGITMVAVVSHTRSIWLAFVGFFQIILSLPVAFFVYKCVAGITFFPYLNYIGVFVLFAVGADDIFVAVDKWKNARVILGEDADVAEVAAEALPDAAGAMLLTTITTAVAFFATAICPIAPIKCFAIFCGLLISFDYILCCAFIFPALCIYDRNRNCCVSFSRRTATESTGDESKKKLTRTQRILSVYHTFLSANRVPLFGTVLVVFSGAAFIARQLELPKSSNVRLLRESNQFEQNHVWRRDLVLAELSRPTAGSAHVVFGLTPADTGDHLDPTTFTELVLNDDFDPSRTEAQLYLRRFCDKLFLEDFATRSHNSVGSLCPLEQFDTWLSEMSSNSNESISSLCGNATNLPVPEDVFHSCATAYVEATGDKNWYIRDGVVRIVEFEFGTQVNGLSSFDQLSSSAAIMEKFLQREIADSAPESATDFYFTSSFFWWLDTNSKLLSTAFGATTIALATSAAVILFSSRSIVLTLIAAFSIAFTLASVVATLVLLNWTLGFLEGICLAVIIGLSADFVIHLCHAYMALPGTVDSSTRTKHAIIQMGPSLLAAAFTTVCAAIAMLFCTATFFPKFGTVLLVTMSSATIASFVVFVVLVEIFGPSQPSSLFSKHVSEEEDPAKPISSNDLPAIKKSEDCEKPCKSNVVEQLFA